MSLDLKEIGIQLADAVVKASQQHNWPSTLLPVIILCDTENGDIVVGGPPTKMVAKILQVAAKHCNQAFEEIGKAWGEDSGKVRH